MHSLHSYVRNSVWFWESGIALVEKSGIAIYVNPREGEHVLERALLYRVHSCHLIRVRDSYDNGMV